MSGKNGSKSSIGDSPNRSSDALLVCGLCIVKFWCLNVVGRVTIGDVGYSELVDNRLFWVDVIPGKTGDGAKCCDLIC